MQNALKKYLDSGFERSFGEMVIMVAKKTGLTENSIRNISRYTEVEVERMYHGTYKRLLKAGVDMDKWEDEVIN